MARRHEKDLGVRELGISADLLGDLEPVHPWHDDVEQHELRLLVPDVDQRRDAVVDDVDVEPALGLLEVAPEGLGDLDVVFDDQDERAGVEALGHGDPALDEESGQHLRVDAAMAAGRSERREVPAIDPVRHRPLADSNQTPDLVRRHETLHGLRPSGFLACRPRIIGKRQLLL